LRPAWGLAACGPLSACWGLADRPGALERPRLGLLGLLARLRALSACLRLTACPGACCQLGALLARLGLIGLLALLALPGSPGALLACWPCLARLGPYRPAGVGWLTWAHVGLPVRCGFASACRRLGPIALPSSACLGPRLGRSACAASIGPSLFLSFDVGCYLTFFVSQC
jgi:hypothetical protein